MSESAKITINDVEYNVDDLSNDAKAFINQIQLIDQKMAPMRAELAIFQTARDTYSNSLNGELENIEK